jgi:hypothetical protein
MQFPMKPGPGTTNPRAWVCPCQAKVIGTAHGPGNLTRSRSVMESTYASPVPLGKAREPEAREKRTRFGAAMERDGQPQTPHGCCLFFAVRVRGQGSMPISNQPPTSPPQISRILKIRRFDWLSSKPPGTTTAESRTKRSFD